MEVRKGVKRKDKERHTQSRSHDDGHRGAELHGESTRRRVQRNAVTQVAHDIVAVGPETDGDGGTAECTGLTLLLSWTD